MFLLTAGWVIYRRNYNNIEAACKYEDPTDKVNHLMDEGMLGFMVLTPLTYGG